MADGDGDNSNSGGSGGKTFSEADVERIVRERVARERGKYADYDDLKSKAQRADSQKSDIDKLTDSVRLLTERAEKAERETIRREIADRLKLPASLAAKLTGTSKDDLEREAKDLVDELKKLGVKFDDDGKSGQNGQGGTGDGKGDGTDGKSGAGQNGGGQGSTGGDGGNAGDNGNGSTGNGEGDGKGGRSILGGRPTENLRSGAGTAGGGQQVDTAKLADSILSPGF